MECRKKDVRRFFLGLRTFDFKGSGGAQTTVGLAVMRSHFATIAKGAGAAIPPTSIKGSAVLDTLQKYLNEHLSGERDTWGAISVVGRMEGLVDPQHGSAASTRQPSSDSVVTSLLRVGERPLTAVQEAMRELDAPFTSDIRCTQQ